MQLTYAIQIIDAVLEHEEVLQSTVSPPILKGEEKKTEEEEGEEEEEHHPATERPTWIPDKWSASCHTCRKPFTKVRRKVQRLAIQIFADTVYHQ